MDEQRKAERKKVFLKRLQDVLKKEYWRYDFLDLIKNLLKDGKNLGLYSGRFLTPKQKDELDALYGIHAIEDRQTTLIEMLELKKHFPELNLG